MLRQVPLADMEIGETGTVVDIVRGMGAYYRLRRLGLRPGTRIAKMSAHFARGPVVVQLGETQVALGFGISRKIIVQVDR